MSTSPETRIESTLITLIDALSYVSTNSIPVRSSDSQDEVKAQSFINVCCQKADRIAPNYDYYRSDVEITTISHIPNDEAQTVAENLYDAVNDWAQNLTAADINTPLADAEITVDGLVPGQNESELEENWRFKTVRFECFYTFTQTT